MNFNIDFSSKTSQTWNEEILKARLTALKRANKHEVWIRYDLTTKKSNAIQRWFWSAVAKHFTFLRKAFYHIDHNRSHKVLCQLKRQISHSRDKRLVQLFNEAVLNFNTITSKHQIELIDSGVFNNENRDITLRYSRGTTTVPSALLITGFKTVEKNKSPEIEIPLTFQKSSLQNNSRNAEEAESEILKIGCAYKKKLETGGNATVLLLQAFEENLPSVAAWLIEQGADISAFKDRERSKDQEAFFQWLKLHSTPVKATPENIDQLAVSLGGGYKYANLKILEEQTKELSQKLKCCDVTVPSFVLLSNFEMQHVLKEGIPELLPMWRSFLKTFPQSFDRNSLEGAAERRGGKYPNKITPEGKEILKDIRLKVTKYFEKNPYCTLQIREWIGREKPHFVIVRSTGKEDSDSCSNPGGNESIPFVLPDEKGISTAVGEVIASYFSEKSVTQRLLESDRSLFHDKEPFTPVLIQTMIGENVAGKGSSNTSIPRSGVIFTRQQEKAEGVTFIQTGLGNNEGVVNSEVGVDTYFVKEKSIHAVVRKKDTRFVCLQDYEGKFKSAPIENKDQGLKCNQALPNSVIHDLKIISDTISERYSDGEKAPKPMDLEYTVKLNEENNTKPTIYLLQARPLHSISEKKSLKHTYLDLNELDKMSCGLKEKTEVLLDGNAYVREIESPSEILFEDNLSKGLRSYLDSDNPNGVKVIVINKTAPATSHEAVSLRPKGVAVVIVDNTEKYLELKKEGMKATKKRPLLVDTQRGLIVKTPESTPAKTLIKEGLISYPIPLALTVPPSSLLEIPQEKKHLSEGIIFLFNKECNLLIKQLQNGKDLYHTKSSKIGSEKIYSIRDLLDIMATAEPGEAKLALATILQLMKTTLINSMSEKGSFGKEINKTMLQVFEAALTISKKELMPALEKYKAQSLERLYPIKFLEALIFQQPPNNVMGAVSYASAFSTKVSQSKSLELASTLGIDIKSSLSQEFLVLLQMTNLAFNEDCANNWKQFIKDISLLTENDKEAAVQDLFNIIFDINKLDMLPIWLNTEFNFLWTSNPDTGEDRVKDVLSSIVNGQKSNSKTMKWAGDRLKKLELREQQIALWSNPEYVKENTDSLLDEFEGYYGFNSNVGKWNSIIRQYNCADDFGSLVLLQYMRRAIDVYDRIIKTVKGSSEFENDKEKALAMADLLDGYFTAMTAMFALIPSPYEQKAIMKPVMGKTILFPEYIKKLEQGTKYEFGNDEAVHSSIGFDNLVHYLRTGKRIQSFNFQLYVGKNPIGEQLGQEEFHKMFPLDEPDYSQQFSKQFEASPLFTVDSLIIGSKADLDFTVHWPNRLEEYFTTFHQNMEQVIKYLNTFNGLNVDILSQQAKDICEMFSDEIEQPDLSTMGINGSTVSAGYQIPLRQHSCSILVKYDHKKPENGADIEVLLFGNDEHARWDQTAAVGTLLAMNYGSGFTNGAPPEINYNHPEGVKLSLHIAKDLPAANLEKVVKTVVYIIKQMTMESAGDPIDLLDVLQNGTTMDDFKDKHYPGLGEIKWKQVPEECFQHTLWLNRELIKEFDAQGQPDMTARVAINSLLGIARNKLSDYERQDGASLKKTALKRLCALIKKDKSHYGKLVEKLLDNPDVKQHLPDVCSSLYPLTV